MRGTREGKGKERKGKRPNATAPTPRPTSHRPPHSHQPRHSVWELFSHVMVLAKGHQLFFGSPDEARAWFTSGLGLKRPPGVPLAEFIMCVQCTVDVFVYDEWCSAWPEGVAIDSGFLLTFKGDYQRGRLKNRLAFLTPKSNVFVPADEDETPRRHDAAVIGGRQAGAHAWLPMHAHPFHHLILLHSDTANIDFDKGEAAPRDAVTTAGFRTAKDLEQVSRQHAP